MEDILMIAFADAPCCTPAPEPLHARFLALLPRIETHARFRFRHVQCPQRKEDCVQEVVAISWKWFIRLAARGKDATAFVSTLAMLAARAVRSGRCVAGMAKARDVLNEHAQYRHGFTVERLLTSSPISREEVYATPHGQRRLNAWEERLRDNTVTSPAEQATFRIDFQAWLKTLTPHERRLVRLMMLNERTKDLARKFDMSPGRISQLRREFRDGWAAFCGDDIEDGSRCTTR